MDTPLEVWTKQEQRSEAQSLWAESVKRCWNSHMFMCSVTGHCSFSEKCVQVDRNVQQIKSGQVTQHHNSVWDSQSPLYEHYLQERHRRGIAVTNAWYFNILWNKLPSAICTEQRGRLSQAVLLLHNNVHRQTAAHIMTTPPMLNWNILNNPAYRKDLMTSDFQLAGLIKDAVRGWSITDHDTMKDAEHYWPHIQLKTLYSDVFKMVVGCWAKCFEKQDDQAES